MYMKQPAEESLAVIRETGTGVIATPFACAHCGTPEHHHGWQYLPGVGLHQWRRPDENLMKRRMHARRAAKEQQ